LEIGAVDPHAMEDDGEFAGHGDRGLAMTLGLYEFYALGLQCRGMLLTGKQGVGGDIERAAHLGIALTGDVPVVGHLA
jgi:hypothetical protein